MNIKNIYHRVVPYTIRFKLQYIIAFILKRELRQRKISLGNNEKDRKFYLIVTSSKYQGLLNKWREIARKVDYGIQHGYVPYIIDDEESLYSETTEWNEYFCQPQDEYSLQKIKSCKNVFISCKYPVGLDITASRNIENDIRFYSYIYKEYIPIKKSIIDGINDSHLSILNNNDVVGINIRREFDWASSLVKGECRAPDEVVDLYTNEFSNASSRNQSIKVRTGDEWRNLIDTILSKMKCEYCFISCDDQEFCETIEKDNPNYIFLHRTRTRFFTDEKPNDFEFAHDINISIKEKNNEYLQETYLLSKCRYIVSSPTSQLYMARIINNDSYKSIMTFDCFE